MSEHATAKANLRREMRARLRAMQPDARAEASLVICQAAANLPAFRKAGAWRSSLPCPRSRTSIR